MFSFLQQPAQWAQQKIAAFQQPRVKSQMPAPLPQSPQSAANVPSLAQPLPRDVMEKRLLVTKLPQRANITLTPEEISQNTQALKADDWLGQIKSQKWGTKNPMDPFGQH